MHARSMLTRTHKATLIAQRNFWKMLQRAEVGSS